LGGVVLPAQTMDIVDMAIQVGGARQGQSFVFKILHLHFGELSLLQIIDPLVRKYVHYQTNQMALLYLIIVL
jgi:hypothetical protein